MKFICYLLCTAKCEMRGKKVRISDDEFDQSAKVTKLSLMLEIMTLLRSQHGWFTVSVRDRSFELDNISLYQFSRGRKLRIFGRQFFYVTFMKFNMVNVRSHVLDIWRLYLLDVVAHLTLKCYEVAKNTWLGLIRAPFLIGNTTCIKLLTTFCVWR